MNIKKIIGMFLVCTLFVSMSFAFASTKRAQADSSIDIWWPTNGARISGTQPFKAMLRDKNVGDYSMTWSVDGGQENQMGDSYTDYPHKEAVVDLTSWTWKGSGPYHVTFKTVDKSGNRSESSVDIYGPEVAQGPKTVVAGTTVLPTTDSRVLTGSLLNVSNSLVAPVISVSTSTIVRTQVPVRSAVKDESVKPTEQNVSQQQPQPVVTQPVVAGNPLSGLKFFVNPNSNAKRTADEWRTSRQDDAYQMDKIATSPEAIWLGGWNGDVQNDVANKISSAKSQSAVPVFIAYNIPNRDCGQYSAGGVSNADAYRSWIQKIAAGINGNKAVVVLEPDALTLTDCLNQEQKNSRFAMLSDAITTLKNAGALVYLDAGHSAWIVSDEMANRLNSAGISKADGFSLNTSNFQTTQSNIDYGTRISSKVGGKHFIIDTARNGVGPTSDNQWCNPPGRALGNRATASTGNSLVDAFLWLKNPGESDGNCNGGPSAGVWWPEYALDLARRSAL